MGEPSAITTSKKCFISLMLVKMKLVMMIMIKVKAIREYAAQEDSEVIVISAKIEEEIATLDD